MLFRADAGHASSVCENDLSYFHFKRVQNQLYAVSAEELKRKLIQKKKETEKLTFKTEFALICHNKVFFTLCTIILCVYRVYLGNFRLK